MTELERALVALGGDLDFPDTPGVWHRVEGRLQRRRWLRPAVFALVAAVVAVGISLAVPPARSAILKFFHIGSVTVERVDTLPPAQNQPFATGLGPTTRVEEARIGEWGMWFTGGMHVLMWQYGNVQTRLAGNVLLWLQNGTTYRLEGKLDKGQMLALARQITR
jgi:hypothetical protein